MAGGDSYETFDDAGAKINGSGSGSSKLPGAPSPSPVQGEGGSKGK